MTCAICGTRRPRRFCPGVRGDICPICCGTEREVTVSCPLDCEYLQEARKHDKPVELDPQKLPNRDIRVSDDFLEEHEPLAAFVAQMLVASALETPGVVDFDAREALESLIRTYRALQSGVYYDSPPANPLAASIHRFVQEGVARYREQEQRRTGLSRTRDADVLGVLVFLQRLELDRNNGRRRGRAFIDLLRQAYSAASGPAAPPASPLVLP